MGRNSGTIALAVALAGGCEEVIIPEKKFDITEICHSIVNGNLRGKVSWIIIVAEGAGSAEDIAKKITKITTLETRPVILGHVQRGGRPTATSRDLALRLGYEAVNCLLRGQKDKAVGLCCSKITTVDFASAIQKKKIDFENWYNLIKALS